MADPTIIPIVFDDQGSTAVLDKYIDAIQELVDEEVKLQKAQESLTDEFKDGATSVATYEKAIDQQAGKVAGAAKEQASLNSEITQSIKDYKVFGVSLNDVTNKYNKYVGILKNSFSSIRSGNDEFVKLNSGLQNIGVSSTAANRATGALSVGFRVLKVAIASTGIGLLVIALGSLVAFLTQTQSGSDKLRVVMAQLGSVVSVVVDRFAALGEAIFKLFEGDFTGAAEAARNAITGIGDEIAEEFELTGLLEKNAIAIEKEGAILEAVNAKRKADLKELNKLAEDITASDADRLSAAQGAARLSEEALASEIRLGQQLIANKLGQLDVNDQVLDTIRELQTGAITADEAIGRIGLDNSNLDDLRDLIGDINAVEAKRAEQLEVQTTLQNKINTIEEQRRAKIEAQRKEQERLTAELNKQLQTIDDLITDIALEELEQNNYPEYLRTVAQLERDRINAIFDSAEAAAQAAGAEIDISEERAIALARIERNLAEELSGIRTGNIAPLEPISSADIELVRERSDEIPKATAEGLKAGEDDVAQAAFSLKTKLFDALGVKEGTPEADFLIESFNTLFDGIQETINFRSERLISEQDAIIDAANERLDDLQSRLDDQRSEQAAGRANDVASLERAIQAEEAILTAAEERRAKLQEAAAKRQLIIESSLQAAGIVTTGVNVLKSETASKGLIGAALGIAFIATLIPLIAGLRKEATAATQLRQGGKLDGPSHEGGGIDILRPGESRPTYNAEGGEWVINKRASSEHDAFLQDLNANKYRGVDLKRMTQVYRNSPLGGRRRDITIPSNAGKRFTQTDMVKAIDTAIDRHTRKLIDYFSKRPIAKSDKDALLYIGEKSKKTYK